MTHSWGDLDIEGRDICGRVNEAAEYIDKFISKVSDQRIMQSKEKFGEVRLYCEEPIGWYQRFIYRLAYKQAIKKWPDLKDEILCCADWEEYLGGLR